MTTIDIRKVHHRLCLQQWRGRNIMLLVLLQPPALTRHTQCIMDTRYHLLAQDPKTDTARIEVVHLHLQTHMYRVVHRERQVRRDMFRLILQLVMVLQARLRLRLLKQLLRSLHTAILPNLVPNTSSNSPLLFHLHSRRPPQPRLRSMEMADTSPLLIILTTLRLALPRLIQMAALGCPFVTLLAMMVGRLQILTLQ